MVGALSFVNNAENEFSWLAFCIPEQKPAIRLLAIVGKETLFGNFLVNFAVTERRHARVDFKWFRNVNQLGCRRRFTFFNLNYWNRLAHPAGWPAVFAAGV